jgi:DNA-binding transcriptional LysR family regulator
MAASNTNQEAFSLKQSAVFVHVADCRNQYAAAQTLFMSPASVSRTLADLESELGTTLFERHHSIAKLTESGRVFLEHAQRILKCQVSLLRAANFQGDEKTLNHRALRITLPQIQAFLAVSKAGAFSAAARKADPSQRSLSRHVNDLEDALSAKLFMRRAIGIQMTEAGKSIIPLVDQLLKLHADASSAMALHRTKQTSKLLIAGSLAVMPQVLPVLLESLKTEFPDYQLELKSDLSDRVEQAVSDGVAIFGLCGTVREKPEFIYTHLLQVQMGLICSPKMQIPKMISTLDDLADIPFVRFDNKALMTSALLANQCSFDAYFRSPVTVSSKEAGMDLVHSGKFAMLITGVGADRQLAQGLQFFALPGLLPHIKVSIIRKRDCLFDERRDRILDIMKRCVIDMPWHASIKVIASK